MARAHPRPEIALPEPSRRAEGTAARTSWPQVDPLRWLWRSLTSVRFALALIAFLALASLVGILVLTQIPSVVEVVGVTFVIGAVAVHRQRDPRGAGTRAGTRGPQERTWNT